MVVPSPSPFLVPPSSQRLNTGGSAGSVLGPQSCCIDICSASLMTPRTLSTSRDSQVSPSSPHLCLEFRTLHPQHPNSHFYLENPQKQKSAFSLSNPNSCPFPSDVSPLAHCASIRPAVVVKNFGSIFDLHLSHTTQYHQSGNSVTSTFNLCPGPDDFSPPLFLPPRVTISHRDHHGFS